MTPVYRRAAPADAALIHQLLCEMAAQDGSQIKGTPVSLAAHGFGPAARFHTLLAHAPAPDGQPLGLLVYFPEYSTRRGGLGLYVQDLYLRPAARGRGLGRALIAAAVGDADWPVQFVALMVARGNPDARAFYAALGFVQREAADPMILADQGLANLTAPQAAP